MTAVAWRWRVRRRRSSGELGDFSSWVYVEEEPRFEPDAAGEVEVERLVVAPRRPFRTLCLECGPDVPIDEDGCCALCGATATGPWLARLVVIGDEQASSPEELGSPPGGDVRLYGPDREPEAGEAAALQAQLARALGEAAGLREALEGVDQVCRDSFRDAGTVENHRTVPVCPLCLGEDVCEEECPAPDVRRALSTSTLAEKAGAVIQSALAAKDYLIPGTPGQGAYLGALARDLDALQAELKAQPPREGHNQGGTQ